MGGTSNTLLFSVDGVFSDLLFSVGGAGNTLGFSVGGASNIWGSVWVELAILGCSVYVGGASNTLGFSVGGASNTLGFMRYKNLVDNLVAEWFRLYGLDGCAMPTSLTGSDIYLCMFLGYIQIVN